MNLLKKSKPTSSADTFAISIESVSTHPDKKILNDSPLLTRTKSEDCISSAEQVRNFKNLSVLPIIIYNITANTTKDNLFKTIF